MPTKSTAEAYSYVDLKMEYVLTTFLGGVIDDFNTSHGWTGSKALRKPKQFFVGVNGVPLAALSSSPVDTTPAIIVSNLSSTTNDDNLISDRNIAAVYEVTCVYVTDQGRIDWASQQTRYLATMAEQVLEAYLVDQQGDPDACVVYNTRLLAPGSGQVIPLQGQDQYLTACSVQMEVSMRANINWSPSRMDPDQPQLPWYPSAFRVPQIASETDLAVSLGVQQPNSSNTLVIASGDLAAATSIVLDTTNWPDGSGVYVVNQMSGDTFNTTTAAGAATIPLATVPAADGDLWVITIVNADTNTPGGYAATWDVTP
jgi:hypothetical protein